VVVAGLLTAHGDSLVARILDGMLSATFPFVVSEPFLAEYRTVLLRLKLCKLYGLSEYEMDAILTDIARHAIVLVPACSQSMAPSAPDPGDQFLGNLLTARADLVRVTGDKLLLQDEAMQPRVIAPHTLLAQLTH